MRQTAVLEAAIKRLSFIARRQLGISLDELLSLVDDNAFTCGDVQRMTMRAERLPV